MICIRCGGEMVKRAVEGVLVDHCPPCNAVWLDAGELEELESGGGRPRQALEEEARAERAVEGEREVATVGLCPRCQRGLVKQALEGVLLDRCPHCGGLFFDHGELGTLLGRRRSGPLAALWARLRGD